MPLAIYTSAAWTANGGIEPAAGATVEVRSEATGSLASLSEDRDGEVGKDNPFTADAQGRFAFFVAGGAYRVKVTDGENEHTLRWQAVGTAGERDIGTKSGEVPTNADILLTEDMTLRIPSDYATLQEAIDETSRFRVRQGVAIELLIESGHQPESGLAVYNGDFGHFIIRSESNDTVFLPSSHTGHFVYARYATAPTLDCVVDMDAISVNNSREIEDPDESDQGRNGYFIDRGSRGLVTSGSGILNCPGRRAIGAFRGSSIEAEGAICTNGAWAGIIAARGSTISAQGATATGFAGRNVYSARSSTLNFHEGNADDGVSMGIVARRGSSINASLATARNCGEAGVFEQLGAIVVAIEIDVSGSETGFNAQQGGEITAPGATANNCSRRVLEASRNVRINIRALSADNCGGDLSGDFSGVIEGLEGSHVNIEEAQITNCQHTAVWMARNCSCNANGSSVEGADGIGYFAAQLSSINCRNANASGTTDEGMEVSNGSFIAANGASGTISQTANSITSDGIIFQ